MTRTSPQWRGPGGSLVTARSAGPIPVRPHSGGNVIDMGDVARMEHRLNTAPLSALLIEHSELGNWLSLPAAELWTDQHREKSARIKAIWQTIQRRFPETAARMGAKV